MGCSYHCPLITPLPPILEQRLRLVNGQNSCPLLSCSVWQLEEMVLFWERPRGPSSLLQPSVLAALPLSPHIPARCPFCHLPSPSQP